MLGVNTAKPVNSTIPFLYKIRKGTNEYRRLALIHPLSQWKIREFYEKYEKYILHLCAKSPASIRAPQKIASTFYSKNSWENINKYKNGSVTNEATDRFTKHSPSFFSYRGYDRLYKFFESRDFFELEKSFAYLWTLDVSKCFDSIYTHCLSWAVKDKEFTKKHVSVESTFGQAFDALMRHANHNETNGIVIGPEVSRIFAEIIFQRVDKLVIERLFEKNNLVFSQQYSFRRYVDDVFIFAKDETVAKIVYECYGDILVTFNLHTNVAKSLRSHRPFFTKKSRIIREASDSANEFVEKFLIDNDERSSVAPLEIHYTWKLTRSYIRKVKSICSYNEADYDEVASYLISLFTERVKKLANVELSGSADEIIEQYRDAALVLLDVLYFLYGVAPSVGASYKLCTSIIVLIRFSEKYLSAHSETIKQRIFELTDLLLTSEAIKKSSGIGGFVSLEAVNIVLAIRELGGKYLLTEETISKLFVKDEQLSYFDIISCLFYVRDDSAYKRIKRKIIRIIESHLSDLSDIFMNTEKACLFLDIMSCPYISREQRLLWLANFYRCLDKPVPPPAAVDQFFNDDSAAQWFVNWTEVDLLNALEKKELKQAY